MHVAPGLGFGLATPIFEAPDEAEHFPSIRFARQPNLPVTGADSGSLKKAWAQFSLVAIEL